MAVSGDIFRVLTITGVPPAATAYTSTDLPIATLSRPDLAVQAGGPYGVDSGTVRTLDAVWSGGTLWATSVDACVPARRLVREVVRARHVGVDFAAAAPRRSRSHARARVVRLLPGSPSGRPRERRGRVRLLVADRLPERGRGDEARTGAVEPVAPARGRDGDADERAVGRLLRRGGRSGSQRARVGVRAGRRGGRRHAAGPRLVDGHRLGHAGSGPARGGDVPGAEGAHHHEDIGDDPRLGRSRVRRDDLPVRVRQERDAVPVRDALDGAAHAPAAADRQRDRSVGWSPARPTTTGSSRRTPSARRPAQTGRSRRSRSRSRRSASSAAPRAPARRACRASRAASPSQRARRCR